MHPTYTVLLRTARQASPFRNSEGLLIGRDTEDAFYGVLGGCSTLELLALEVAWRERWHLERSVLRLLSAVQVLAYSVPLVAAGIGYLLHPHPGAAYVAGAVVWLPVLYYQERIQRLLSDAAVAEEDAAAVHGPIREALARRPRARADGDGTS